MYNNTIKKVVKKQKQLTKSKSLRIITNTENNKMQIIENRERNKKDQPYEEFV